MTTLRVTPALALLALAAASNVAPAQQAVITPLTGLPSPINIPNSSPVDINNAGHFVALSNLYGFDPATGISYPGVTHSFLAITPSSAIDLGVLGVDPPPFVFPRAENTATRINNLDQIATNSGDAAFFGRLTAAAWLPAPAYGFPAGLNPLPSLTAPNIDRAFGFNDAGVLVGESRDPANNIRPVRWTLNNGAATVEDIAIGFGPNGRAFDVNNAGQIVGQVNEPNPIPFNNFFQAFLYLPEPAYGLPAGVNILQAPDVETADNLGFPNRINQLGQVFGRTAGGAYRPALWLPEPALGLPAGVTLFNNQVFPDEAFIRLGAVGLQFAEFKSANNNGVAVGEAGFLRFITIPRPRFIVESHAFIWQNGQFQLLESFLPVGSPWVRIFSADGVNDSGVISAMAQNSSGGFFAVRITLDGPSCPSAITRQPRNASVCAGETAAIDVVVNGGGGGDLLYTWRHDGVIVNDGPAPGGGTIEGSGTLQLRIVGAGLADIGDYDVEISNTCGTLSSHSASLDVRPLPTFTTQPQDTSACFGGAATLSAATDDASASGNWQIEDPAAPGSFLFIFDGPNTIGDLSFDAAGTSTGDLALSNLGSAAADLSARFTFEVETDCGTFLSDPATLTLHSCRCPADFNGDGDVNPDDLGDFITCYFSTPACDRADFNADRDVNPDDLGDFITTYFGPPC